MASHWRLFAFVLVVLTPAGALAQTPATQTVTPQTDVYIPPPRGAPDGRISGGTRGVKPAVTPAPPQTRPLAKDPKPKPSTVP